VDFNFDGGGFPEKKGKRERKCNNGGGFSEVKEEKESVKRRRSCHVRVLSE